MEDKIAQRAVKQDQVPREKVFEDVQVLARIANAIEIDQQYEAGSLKQADTFRELLNLKKSVNVDQLEKEKLADLQSELATMAGAVDKACGAQGENCKLDDGVKGIEALELIGDINVDFGQVLAKGSALETVGSIQSVAKSGETLKSAITELINVATSLKNGFQGTQIEREKIASKAQLNIEQISSFLSAAKSISPNKIEVKSLNKGVDTILKLNDVVLAFTNKNLNIGFWSKKYSNLAEVIKNLKSILSEDNLKKIERKMDLLLDIIDGPNASMDDKVGTLGFPNGASDVLKLRDDLDSTFAIQILLQGADDNRLRSLVPYTLQLGRELKAVSEIKDKISPLEVIVSASNLKQGFESVRGEIQNFEPLLPLFAGIQNLSGFDEKLDLQEWITAKKTFNTYEAELNAVSDKLSKVTGVKLDAFSRLQKTFAQEKTFDEKSSAFVAFGEFDAVITELTSLQTEVGNALTTTLFQWAVTRDITNLISLTNERLGKIDIASMLVCTKDKKMLQLAKNVFTNQNLSVILMFNSQNKDTIIVTNAASLVKPFLSGYKDLRANMEKRAKRAAGSKPHLGKAVANKNFYQFSNIINSAKTTKDNGGSFAELVSHRNEVISAIVATSNAKAKKEFEFLTVLSNFDKLQTAFNAISQAATSLVPRPLKVKDYKEPLFHIEFNSKSIPYLDFGHIVDSLVAINSPYPTLAAAGKLRELRWAFMNLEGLNKGAQKEFLELIEFFDKIARESDPKWVKADKDGKGDTDTGSGGWNRTTTISVCVCVVIVAVLSGVGAWFYRKSNRKYEEQLKKMIDDGSANVCKIKGKKRVYLTIEDYPVDDQPGPPAPTVPLGNQSQHVGMARTAKSEKPDLVFSFREHRRLRKLLDMVKNQMKVNEIVQNGAKNPTNFHLSYVSPQQIQSMRSHKVEAAGPSDKGQVEFDLNVTEYIVGVGKTTYGLTREPIVPLEEVEADEANNAVFLEASQKLTAHNTSMIKMAKGKNVKNNSARGERNEAGGDDKKKSGDSLFPTGLEQVNTTALQLIKRYPKDLPSGNFDAEDDHSAHFFPMAYPIYDDRGEPDYNNFISAMYSEKMQLIDQFPTTINGQRVNYPVPVSYVIKILERATQIFKEESAFLVINRKKVTYCGDFHGSFRDFSQQTNPVLFDEDGSMVFCGDYVDRGPRSIDVINLLAALKVTNPDKFSPLAGNHEYPTINYFYGFYEECFRTFGKNDGNKYYRAANKMFRAMPTAALVNGKIFCAHGGPIPEMLSVSSVEELKAIIKKEPVKEDEAIIQLGLRWADYVEAHRLNGDEPDYEDMFCNSKRNSLVQNFTQHGSNYTMSKIGASFGVRAHQVISTGIRLFAGTKGATIFGACNNTQRNMAATLTITHDMKASITRYTNPGDAEGPRNDCKTEPRKSRSH